ncbi:protein phosphatase 2C domain-containing protein [Thioalkalivibrio sp. ALE28]|uniref:protein phosphatase 2C domain-containing protein n=1 Tax=Thioalkalivibrio sp. ALE28 TaxID=1158179 RepID=UPI0021018D3E|nr:protein phosphatase 2C domain-containing protein [Thioalkalivibrio sp. ALE28]
MRLGFGTSQALVTCPTGATHLEKGQPCQDACMVAQHYYRGVPYTVMVVADGHGSAKYSRSDVGAHFAVEAAGDAATELVIGLASMREEHPDDWHKQMQHEVSHRLGRVLVQRWRTRIDEHAAAYPELGVEPGSDACLDRYGSTVAMVIIYDDQWLITANLGDSSIYLARREGNGYDIQELAAQNRESFGLGTDSLVSPRANYLWRSEILSTTDEPPAMILLTTDGLTDSVGTPQDSIVDLCEQTMCHGMDWLARVLPQQLARWSADGVGDDMGCIVWFPTLSPPSSASDSNHASSSTNPDTPEQVAPVRQGHSGTMGASETLDSTSATRVQPAMPDMAGNEPVASSAGSSSPRKAQNDKGNVHGEYL